MDLRLLLSSPLVLVNNRNFLIPDQNGYYETIEGHKMFEDAINWDWDKNKVYPMIVMDTNFNTIQGYIK